MVTYGSKVSLQMDYFYLVLYRVDIVLSLLLQDITSSPSFFHLMLAFYTPEFVYVFGLWVV
jgi:hypothetical protein